MADARYTLDDIHHFLADQLGISASAMRTDDDLNRDHGVEGDDFFDLMKQFGAKFGVDLSTYRWYFHHGEEPHWGMLFQWLFRAPYQQVNRIPITPAMLLASANAGKWQLDYPPHSLSKRRYDAIAAWCFPILAIVVLLGFACLRR